MGIEGDRNGKKGLTLVEVAVTLGIIGMLAVMALPSYLGWRKLSELRTAAGQVSGVMMFARTRSIVERRNYTLLFDLPANSYTLTPAGGSSQGPVGEKWRRVEIYTDTSDAACPNFVGAKVVFRPNATTDTAGTRAVYLRIPGVAQRYRIKVTGTTGRIGVERWEGSTWKSTY